MNNICRLLGEDEGGTGLQCESWEIACDTEREVRGRRFTAATPTSSTQRSAGVAPPLRAKMLTPGDGVWGGVDLWGTVPPHTSRLRSGRSAEWDGNLMHEIIGASRFRAMALDFLSQGSITTEQWHGDGSWKAQSLTPVADSTGGQQTGSARDHPTSSDMQ